MVKYTIPGIVFTLIQLSACSNQSSNFVIASPSTDEQSLIYIYRPSSMSNAIISPLLNIDGDKTLNIKNNSYTYTSLSSGTHIFRLELSDRYTGNMQVSLKTEAKQLYYLKVSTAIKFEKNKPYTRRFDIRLVEVDTAMSEIKQLNYLESNDITPNTAEKSINRSETGSNNIFTKSKTGNPFSKN